MRLSIERCATSEKMVLVAGEDGKRRLYLPLGRRKDIGKLEVLLA